MVKFSSVEGDWDGEGVKGKGWRGEGVKG